MQDRCFQPALKSRKPRGNFTVQKLMPTRSSSPSRAKRNPRPPLPSRLKPAQYAKLLALVGNMSDQANGFFRECRERLSAWGHGEFSVDDLINEALRRLFLGTLPKGMNFPASQHELIAAVERLGKLHAENAARRHRYHGPRPVSLDDDLPAELIAQASPKQFTSLQAMQLDILRRLEGRLVTRIAQLEPVKTESEESFLQHIEIF